MARLRINHYASRTINVGSTVDGEAMIIELFISLLLGVFAYMGYVANIALLLFLCAAGSLACFLAFLHNVYIVIADKLEASRRAKGDS